MNNQVLRDILVDCLTYAYELMSDERHEIHSIYLHPEKHARFVAYKTELVKLDSEAALKLFVAHNDKQGLTLLVKSQEVSEQIKRDCREYLHPLQKTRPRVHGSDNVSVEHHSGDIKPIIDEEHDLDRSLGIIEDGRS